MRSSSRDDYRKPQMYEGLWLMSWQKYAVYSFKNQLNIFVFFLVSLIFSYFSLRSPSKCISIVCKGCFFTTYCTENIFVSKKSVESDSRCGILQEFRVRRRRACRKATGGRSRLWVTLNSSLIFSKWGGVRPSFSCNCRLLRNNCISYI